MELMPKCSLANHKLGCISSIQAVNAIGPGNSILHLWNSTIVAAITKEACSSYYVFRNRLGRGYESSQKCEGEWKVYDASPFRRPAHIPCLI